MSLTLTQIVEVAAADNEFVPGMSSNEFFYCDQVEERLTDVIATIADEVRNRATETHTHTGYAEAGHTHTPESIGAAPETHTHDYASSDHAHTEYAPASHSHTGYADENHAHTEYAPASHNHTGYADEDHSHSEYAPKSHSHSGYASSAHTHTEYASEDHSHPEYFNANNGGSIGGDTNINGVFRGQGQQVISYNDTTNTQTFGTNNATGGTTIACGSSATVGVNGSMMKTPTILPRANNTFTCGNSNFRWSGIYSTTAVNVSSDERMKRNIGDVDVDQLFEFVNNLEVVRYNYKDDPADADARIGLIAQQVYQADPDVADFFISEDANGMLGLKPADLVFPLIAAVQKLTAEVECLKSKI